MAAEPGRGATLVSDLLGRVRAAVDLDDVLSPDLDPVEIRSQLWPVARSSSAMTWVGVNGSRVDVILSDDVDEWRVVLGTDDGERVDWLFAYRRPPFFNGVPGGKAVIVNGPSGAGKSTLLDSLRRTEAGMPWVIFDEPEDVGSVDAEFLIWREQAPALHEGFLAAIGALARSGNLVAVAAGGRTQAEFERHLAGTPTMWVGLYCDPDVLIARGQSRTDRWGGLAEASVSVHDGWAYDLTFDTTDSPDLSVLARAILGATESDQA